MHTDLCSPLILLGSWTWDSLIRYNHDGIATIVQSFSESKRETSLQKVLSSVASGWT